MTFPWVSREQHEYVKEQLKTVDAERRRLLDLLLADEREKERERKPLRLVEQEVQQAETVEPAVPIEAQGESVAYSTPFDRILQRFDGSHRGGSIPAKFRVRVN